MQSRSCTKAPLSVSFGNYKIFKFSLEKNIGLTQVQSSYFFEKQHGHQNVNIVMKQVRVIHCSQFRDRMRSVAKKFRILTVVQQKPHGWGASDDRPGRTPTEVLTSVLTDSTARRAVAIRTYGCSRLPRPNWNSRTSCPNKLKLPCGFFNLNVWFFHMFCKFRSKDKIRVYFNLLNQ